MRHLVIASVLLCAGCLGNGIALGQSGSPLLDAAPIVACDASANGGSGANATAREQLANGLDLAILTDTATDAWPRTARGLTLTLRLLLVEAGAASETRITEGPLLYFVEQGVVGISINSRLSTYSAGDVALVGNRQRYTLQNDGDATARLLRVQIVKPGDETSVGADWGASANVTTIEKESPPGPPSIRTRLLLSGEIPKIDGSQRVIFGCLIWRAAQAETGPVVHSGPVAFLVLRGEMLVNDIGHRKSGDCTGFQAGVSHRLRAGADLPVVLLVAVIPDDGPWWGRGNAREVNPNLKFRCGEPAAPDDGS